jgi:hypothetical protein
MPDGESHGRVDGIELVDADRWVSGCGHLKAPFMSVRRRAVVDPTAPPETGLAD